jgi:flavin-dependent dehydrogenase
MCAGTIGNRLADRLREFGAPLTPQVILHDIQGFTFHARDDWVDLRKGGDAKIYGVFRGGGPRQSRGSGEKDEISFDQFILDYALRQGAQFQEGEVVNVQLTDNQKPKVWFKPKVFDQEQLIEADLLGGAFGVNSSLLNKFTFGYRPPMTWHTCQSEIRLGKDYIKERFRDMIHIFPIYSKNIHYIAVTPKGEYITVSAIGPYIKIRILEDILRTSKISQSLPSSWQTACHCHPQIPITPSKMPYTDKFVIMGDASYSRYLKNGIESAFDTAYFAAETVFHRGISAKAFDRGFDRRSRQRFVRDNIYGKFLFKMYEYVFTSNLFAHPLMALLKEEQEGKITGNKPLSEILWGMFTGEVPYWMITRKAFNLSLLSGLFNSIQKFWWLERKASKKATTN